MAENGPPKEVGRLEVKENRLITLDFEVVGIPERDLFGEFGQINGEILPKNLGALIILE